jgi:hypothetical protein
LFSGSSEPDPLSCSVQVRVFVTTKLKNAVGARFWLRSTTELVRCAAVGRFSGSGSTNRSASTRMICSRAASSVAVIWPVALE